MPVQEGEEVRARAKEGGAQGLMLVLERGDAMRLRSPSLPLVGLY